MRPATSSTVRGGPSTPAEDDAAEQGSVAREMAAGYRRLVESYRREWGLSAADADARAREPGSATWREGLANRAPESLSWWELASLAEQDPDLMHALWERTKREAARELASGHRAAGALEFMGTPWDRARFLAVRAAFREEWRPRGGVEDALIDAMAQAYTAYLDWLRVLHTQERVGGGAGNGQHRAGGALATAAGRESPPRSRKRRRWPIGSTGCSCGRCGRCATCGATPGR